MLAARWSADAGRRESRPRKFSPRARAETTPEGRMPMDLPVLSQLPVFDPALAHPHGAKRLGSGRDRRAPACRPGGARENAGRVALFSFPVHRSIIRSLQRTDRILLFPQNKTQANAWRWRPFGYAGIGVDERRRPALTRKPNRSFRSGGRGHRPQTAQSRVFRDATTQKENCTVRAVFVVRKKALNS